MTGACILSSRRFGRSMAIRLSFLRFNHRCYATLPRLRQLTSQQTEADLPATFRELGRAARLIFLLCYMSDLELRHVINTATTKSERFNNFVQWVSFGGDSLIAENVRDEQRKSASEEQRNRKPR